MNVGDFLKKNINLLKGYYEGSDLNTDKVMSRIEKNKNAFIAKPYSDRTFTKNEDGSFIGGNILVGNEQEENPGSKVISLPSTAIDSVGYNPEEEIASIKFVNGKKVYDYSVSPEEFKDFMNAPSKGRHVSKLWNHNSRFSI